PENPMRSSGCRTEEVYYNGHEAQFATRFFVTSRLENLLHGCRSRNHERCRIHRVELHNGAHFGLEGHSFARTTPGRLSRRTQARQRRIMMYELRSDPVHRIVLLYPSMLAIRDRKFDVSAATFGAILSLDEDDGWLLEWSFEVQTTWRQFDGQTWHPRFYAE